MQPFPLSLDFENTKIYVICLTCTLELLQVPTDIHCGKRTLLRGSVNNLTQARKESAQLCSPCFIIWEPNSWSCLSHST